MRFVGTMTFALEAKDVDDCNRILKGWHEKVIAASQRTSMHFRPGVVTAQAQPERPVPEPEITDEPERLFDS